MHYETDTYTGPETKENLTSQTPHLSCSFGIAYVD